MGNGFLLSWRRNFSDHFFSVKYYFFFFRLSTKFEVLIWLTVDYSQIC